MKARTMKERCTIERKQGLPRLRVGMNGLVTPTGQIDWYVSACGRLSKGGPCLSCRRRKEGGLDLLTDKGKKQLDAFDKAQEKSC
jgi:hypothetical protein